MEYKNIYLHYSKLAPLNELDWLQMESLMTRKQVKKGEKLVRPGEVCERYRVIISGLFKLYYIGNDGREYIKVFRKENDLLAPYAEMLQNIPSRTFIEALEDSEVAQVEAHDFERLINKNPSWKELRGKINERLFIEKEEKEFNLLQLSATERYDKFIQNQPRIAKRISQYNIASYLGITPVALSRIIKRNR